MSRALMLHGEPAIIDEMLATLPEREDMPAVAKLARRDTRPS
jgi:hypothetical protein